MTMSVDVCCWSDMCLRLYWLVVSCRVVWRLWIVPKGYGDSVEPQQIGYVNVVPARNEFGVFDGFGDTVRKFNQHLRVHPLPGATSLHMLMSY